jgi:hypothetical protein
MRSDPQGWRARQTAKRGGGPEAEAKINEQMEALKAFSEQEFDPKVVARRNLEERAAVRRLSPEQVREVRAAVMREYPGATMDDAGQVTMPRSQGKTVDWTELSFLKGIESAPYFPKEQPLSTLAKEKTPINMPDDYYPEGLSEPVPSVRQSMMSEALERSRSRFDPAEPPMLPASPDANAAEAAAMRLKAREDIGKGFRGRGTPTRSLEAQYVRDQMRPLDWILPSRWGRVGHEATDTPTRTMQSQEKGLGPFADPARAELLLREIARPGPEGLVTQAGGALRGMAPMAAAESADELLERMEPEVREYLQRKALERLRAEADR